MTSAFRPQGTTEWELDSLEPIIAVPKSDGTVHLCGVYTVTVNQDLEIAQYPLPVPEDLMSSLTRGKAFMKLDLSSAYQQMLLESLTIINTHHGLYC